MLTMDNALRTFVSSSLLLRAQTVTHSLSLAFAENLVMLAHPSKSGGAWWYGSLVKGGKTGFFPSTYVQELETGQDD